MVFGYFFLIGNIPPAGSIFRVKNVCGLRDDELATTVVAGIAFDDDVTVFDFCHVSGAAMGKVLARLKVVTSTPSY